MNEVQKDPIQLLKEAADKMHLASCAIVKHLFGLEEELETEIKKKVKSLKKTSKDNKNGGGQA